MKLAYRDYMKIGVSHHLLYKFCIHSPESHLQTMRELLADERPEVFDLWISNLEPFRSEEIRLIRDCGREVIYNIGDQSDRPSLCPTARERTMREYTMSVFKNGLECAMEAGIRKTVTSSGMQHDLDDEGSFEAIRDFYCALCEFVGPEMRLIVEPTDYNWDKRFYIGSSAKAMRLIQAVRACGYENIGGMVDMCHLPLMFETIPQAMCDLAGSVEHLHLGTCVRDDRSSPIFGDRHPAWGMPGTIWGKAELQQLFYEALKSGYFSKTHRGTASFEMIAYDKEQCLLSLGKFLQYVQEAWDEMDYTPENTPE